MPRRLPPLNALRAFEAAGRHGSFTGAATELNVTHAAISRHVRGLEQRLGTQLFQTAARGVVLTETGSDYLAAITPAFDSIATATETISTNTIDVLKISCEPTFASKWLMPHLGAFLDTHPDIDVQLQVTSTLSDLKRYESDIAIRYSQSEQSDFSAELICRYPIYPFAAPKFAAVEDPAELLAFRLLHDDKGQLWTRWFLEAGIDSFTLQRPPNPLPTSLAIEGALAGQGVVLTSAELVHDDIASGRLHRLSDIGFAWGAYHILCLPEIARRQPVRAFRDWVLEATAELREKD